MNLDTSLLHFIAHAGIVVKFVLLILIITSILSWTIIFQRFSLYRDIKQQTQMFEKQFRSQMAFDRLYHLSTAQRKTSSGIRAVFIKGFGHYQQLIQSKTPHAEVLENVERSMQTLCDQTIAKLQQQLGFLATVGSTSPYIGLFGTVWGIMNAFTALGHVQQATIAMVAPGIAEALIATAIGLFTAIPAVIAYNRFSLYCSDTQTRFHQIIDTMITDLQREHHLSSRTSTIISETTNSNGDHLISDQDPTGATDA